MRHYEFKVSVQQNNSTKAETIHIKANNFTEACRKLREDNPSRILTIDACTARPAMEMQA